jgi:hypothetical protein
MVARAKKVNTEPEAQVLAEQTAVIPVTISNVSLGTLQATSPAALVSGAAEMAKELAQVIDKQNLATTIKGKRFVGVEGWTTLATMLGVTAREVSTTESDGIYTATVELVRMSDGACISRASAECGAPDELDKYGKPIWSARPRYARRSMAQTRATGKACRLAFSWIMSLAGYEVTPAEEMTPIVETEKEKEPEREKSARINERQHRNLEATINEYGLNRERVKSWINAAWDVQHLNDLTVSQFQELLKRLKVWAEREYAKAAQDYAACASEYEEPLTYADIRG